MRRTPPLSALLTTIMVIGLAGCASSPAVESTSPSATGGLKSIFMANPLPAYPDWAKFDECFLAHAKELGLKADTAGPTALALDNAFSVDRISQAITQDYDAILMVPVEPAQFNPLMQRAKDAGTIVGTINTADSTSLQDFTVGTAFDAYGANVAKEIGKISGDQKLLIVTNGPGGAGDEIIAGLTENLPGNVQIVDTVFDNADASQTTDVVSRALTAHPDTTVVWSWEGTAVAGITTAIKEKGLNGTVFGVVNDLTDQVIAGIRDGSIYGTSKQDFCLMATTAIDNAVAVANGEDVAANTDTGTVFVTAENLDETLKESK